jgi:hypothetical protein
MSKRITVVMDDDKMIQHLQDRFGLSKVKATVIYFRLEEHFTKNGKMFKESSPESSESLT